MTDITTLLEEIKASPYREIAIKAPHCGKVTFANVETGSLLLGPQGQWKEKPGTQIAIIDRERNPKPINAPEKGELTRIFREHEGKFVDAGTTLAIMRHLLTRSEVERIILQKSLYLFKAPERAKYYFTPEVDKKIRASDAHSVLVRDDMELLIMSRMKREMPLRYSGPDGVIYAVYFKYNENVEAGEPLVGICPKDQLPVIQDVIMRVRTEWRENG